MRDKEALSKNNKMSLDQEWELFVENSKSSNKFANFQEDDDDDDEDGDDDVLNENNSNYFFNNSNFENKNLPKNFVANPSDLYISTKSKIIFLNSPIDLKKLFWELPVIPYSSQKCGIIKKQIKYNSIDESELNEMQEKLKKEEFFEEYIICSINNPEGRIKFKDVRKLSVGISKKDLICNKTKQKSAFYNCIVLIIRMIDDNGDFKENHVKLFNTGKIGVAGVKSNEEFFAMLDQLISYISPNFEHPIMYIKDTAQTILINSNFNSGFNINREVFVDILKKKYNIECIYDPCSYPGIQCKYTYDTLKKNDLLKNVEITDRENIKVSFMIFRTGSILIVGKCDEVVLNIVYEFLKKIIIDEYKFIFQSMNPVVDDKQKKTRKKQTTFLVTDDFEEEIELY